MVTQGPSGPGCSKARRGQARLGPGCTRGCLLGLGARSHCPALQGAWKRILPSVPEVDESTDFFKSGAASVDVVRCGGGWGWSPGVSESEVTPKLRSGHCVGQRSRKDEGVPACAHPVWDS